MKNLLEFLLLHLVDHPEDIVIDEVEEENQTRFIIHVHPEDMGKVIGKRGAVIDAIRKISKVRAVKEGIRAYVSVAEVGENPVGESTSNNTSIAQEEKPKVSNPVTTEDFTGESSQDSSIETE
jgi:predicted RNA-binding protein YlqC (UPF0109 family)